MSLRLVELEMRRERLVAQAAAQRMALAHDTKSLRVPFAVADYALAALRFAVSHPVLLVGSGVMFSVLRAGRVGRWMKRGWTAWRVMRNMISR